MSYLVSDYASRRVLTLTPDELVSEAAARLAQADVTGAPVVDAQHRVVGVLSLTNIIALRLMGPVFAALRAGPDEDAAHHHADDIAEETKVADIMTRDVQSARLGEPLAVAARRMVDAKVHRLVVVDDAGHARGILSTLDVMRAARDLELTAPASRYATMPVECVEATTPVGEAIARLLDHHHHGMPVTENGAPFGLLTQTEIIRARTLAPETPTRDVASRDIQTVEHDTPLWAAAARGIDENARRLLLTREGQVTGILVSLDFARAFAEA